jgi:uncharacterized membrane protein YtjA (UPF0391 family)
MIHYAVIFFVIALIAAVFGFAGIAAGASGVAKILFFVFLILAVISFIANTACEDTFPREPTKKELEEQRRLERIAELRKLFRMGREFHYLGVRMRVTSRTHTVWGWDDAPSPPIAELRCEYIARDGTVKEARFSLEEARVLAQELAPNE